MEFTKEIDSIIIEEYPSGDINDICKKTGLGYRKLIGRASRLGIKRRISITSNEYEIMQSEKKDTTLIKERINEINSILSSEPNLSLEDIESLARERSSLEYKLDKTICNECISYNM